MGPLMLCGVVLEILISAALYKGCQYHTRMLYRKSYCRSFSSVKYLLYKCIIHSEMWEADKWNKEAAYQAVTILYRGEVIYVNDFIEFNHDYLGSEPVVAKVQQYWIDVSSSKT